MFNQPLRSVAMDVWLAGVRAVNSHDLVRQAIQTTATSIQFGDTEWPASPSARICLVGGGKAGTGMVQGLEQALGEHWLQRTSGWVNVPEGTENAPTRTILHPARPAGVNEPRAEGVLGTQEILKLVSKCSPDDLCIVLLSGGGSALLPAPRTGITLEEKIAITRKLSRAGATIQELNTVRRQISDIKGGGLLRACRARTVVSLIISDVIGDPLDIIASGPTFPSELPLAVQIEIAVDVLERLLPQDELAEKIANFILQQPPDQHPAAPEQKVVNHIVGNNQTAVQAAASEARSRGFEIRLLEFDRPGIAKEEGVRLTERLLSEIAQTPDMPICLISGGEPVVKLNPSASPQKGGRNQELALSAVQCLWNQPEANLVLLAGGTDGEDGPTDAAGAMADAQIIARATQLGLDPQVSLDANNSYEFFDCCNGLLKTGPTGTNVMDLRVALYDPREQP